LGKAKDTYSHEKLLLALYWLKIQTVETVSSIAVKLGKHRTTVQRCLPSYRSGGMTELLYQKQRSGRPRIINPETLDRLEKELQEPEGFKAIRKSIKG